MNHKNTDRLINNTICKALEYTRDKKQAQGPSTFPENFRNSVKIVWHNQGFGGLGDTVFFLG